MTDAVPAVPAVVAHRGAWDANIPENSVQAFEWAIELGADMIEFDIRRTRDGELIIFHDAELAGTAVSALTRDEIATVTGASPPLLEEVLELAAGRIAVDAELKENGYVDQVTEMLVDFAAGGSELIVTSFIDVVIAQLTELAPEIPRGLLFKQATQSAHERARACGATMVLPHMRVLGEALITEVSAAGLDLIVWDFMANDHAALLSETRISGVITDDVPGAIAERMMRSPRL